MSATTTRSVQMFFFLKMRFLGIFILYHHPIGFNCVKSRWRERTPGHSGMSLKRNSSKKCLVCVLGGSNVLSLKIKKTQKLCKKPSRVLLWKCWWNNLKVVFTGNINVSNYNWVKGHLHIFSQNWRATNRVVTFTIKFRWNLHFVLGFLVAQFCSSCSSCWWISAKSEGLSVGDTGYIEIIHYSWSAWRRKRCKVLAVA